MYWFCGCGRHLVRIDPDKFCVVNCISMWTAVSCFGAQKGTLQWVRTDTGTVRATVGWLVLSEERW